MSDFFCVRIPAPVKLDSLQESGSELRSSIIVLQSGYVSITYNCCPDPAFRVNADHDPDPATQWIRI